MRMRTYSISVNLVQRGNSCGIFQSFTIVAPNADQACQRAVDCGLEMYPQCVQGHVSAISCSEANPDGEASIVPGIY